MNKLFDVQYQTIEIMSSGKIIVSGPSPECAGNVFSICGNNEPSRDYATSWYSDKNQHIAAHIYVSSANNCCVDKLLDGLSKLLDTCNSVDDLMALNGKSIS